MIVTQKHTNNNGMKDKELEKLLIEFGKSLGVYEMSRRGAFDFPTEEEFFKGKVKAFKLNNPELFGYEWDEDNEDWVRRGDGWLSRMVDRTEKIKDS